MSYRKELEQLASELEEQARTIDFTNDPKASEKHEHFHRCASLHHSEQCTGGGTMRRFMLLLVTEIDFVSQGNDSLAGNYEQNLATVVQEAAQKLSLRAVQGTKVVKVQVAETKNLVSL